jgi:hypothetical protein
LEKLRALYEPNAQALADFLALELPPWFRRDVDGVEATLRVRAGRDLVG